MGVANAKPALLFLIKTARFLIKILQNFFTFDIKSNWYNTLYEMKVLFEIKA